MNKKTTHWYSTRLLLSLLALAAVAIMNGQSAFAFQDSDEDDGPTLVIGSEAPALDVEHWVSDRDGKFEKVTEFEDGKVYVVEFWATWCGPCISAMPHIRELQDEYYDKGVQVISISDEKLKTVEKFLDRDVRGEEDMTYSELTSAYCLTTDPDKSTHEDYMRAANENGIPTAFIVGKKGIIEWIGHPMQIDEPIKAIVNDEWDREAYKVEREAEQRMQIAMQGAMSKIGRLMQRGKPEEALEALDEAIEDAEDEDVKEQLTELRPRIMMEIGGPEALEAMKMLVKENSDDANALNAMAWGVVEQSDAGDEISPEMLETALEAAELGVKAARKMGNGQFLGAVLDTHAHLLYMNGELDRAIEVQTEAVEEFEDDDVLDYLDMLIEEKEGGEGDDDENSDEEDDDSDK